MHRRGSGFLILSLTRSDSYYLQLSKLRSVWDINFQREAVWIISVPTWLEALRSQKFKQKLQTAWSCVVNNFVFYIRRTLVCPFAVAVVLRALTFFMSSTSCNTKENFIFLLRNYSVICMLEVITRNHQIKCQILVTSILCG